jgi:eukaryotic-like serine/threonine-protein kinase
MTVSAGTRLGPYEIVDSLGAGGMGEVWRAKDTRLNREVAIKILPQGFADDEQFQQRFEREARTISSLNHPHICTLFDVGEEVAVAERRTASDSLSPLAPRPSPLHYLVMELIEGESLADRLMRGPLPLHDVLKYGRQIASALDAAHRRGVIHRDLKPGNIMLTKSGAKLLDFGLAKSASEGRGPIDGLTNMPTAARPLTRRCGTGMTAGFSVSTIPTACRAGGSIATIRPRRSCRIRSTAECRRMDGGSLSWSIRITLSSSCARSWLTRTALQSVHR